MKDIKLKPFFLVPKNYEKYETVEKYAEHVLELSEKFKKKFKEDYILLALKFRLYPKGSFSKEWLDVFNLIVHRGFDDYLDSKQNIELKAQKFTNFQDKGIYRSDSDISDDKFEHTDSDSADDSDSDDSDDSDSDEITTETIKYPALYGSSEPILADITGSKKTGYTVKLY